MKRLRKILILTLAGLCGLFGIVAACNGIAKIIGNYESPNASLYQKKTTTEWGNSLELLARQNNKLIFFTIKGSGDFRPDANFKNLLDKFFYVVELDSEQWPADYKILDNIFRRTTKSRKHLGGGILLPTLAPLYLFSEAKENGDMGAPSIFTAASALAVKFVNEKENTIKASKEFLSVMDTEYGIEADGIAYVNENTIAWNAESIKLNDFFSRDISQYPLAVITENARLAARIYLLSRTFNLAESAALKAQSILTGMFETQKSMTRKLLSARALFEIAIITNSRGNGKSLLDFCDSIISKIYPDGRMKEPDSEGLLVDNALAIHVLALAFEYSGERKYLQSAQRIADSIEIIFKSMGQLPAILNLGKPSQSSSITYAFVAGAFSNLYYFTGDKKYLALCKMIFDEWNKLFLCCDGVWSINSYASAMANISRPIIYNDDDLPSYIGEAAQIIRYLKSVDGAFDIPSYQKIDAASANVLRYYNVYKYTMGSWKLSKVPDKLRGAFRKK